MNSSDSELERLIQERTGDLQRRLVDLTVLYRICEICSQVSDEDDVLQRVTEALVSALAENNCGFVMVDSQRACLTAHPSFFVANPRVDRSEIPVSKGVIGLVARTGQTRRINDVHLEPNYWAADSTTCSELCVPVRCRGAVVGVINVERPTRNAFSAEDEQLVVTVANLVGAALERITTMRELRESEERYRRLFETCGDSIFVLDSSGRIRAANPAAARIHDYTEEELLTMNIRDLDDPESARQVPDRLHRLLAGEALTFEVDHRRRDGSMLPMEVAANLMQVGSESFILSFNRDVTERKRAEQSLREGHRYFSALFEQPSIAVGQLDSRTGRFLRVNQRYCEMLGYSQDELLQLDYMAITHPDDLQDDLDNMARLKTGELSTFQMAKRLYRHDGTEIWVHLTVVPLWMPDAEPDFHLALVEDITERRRMEHSLRLTQFSIDRAVDSMYWVAPNAEILYVNDAASRLLGYTRKELIGKTVPDIDPKFPAAAWPAHWDELKRRGSFSLESVQLTKDGRLLQTEVTVNYLCYEGQEYNCAVVRDITERKRQEQSLRLTQFTVDCAANPIFWVSPQAEIRYVNDAACRLLGYSPEELTQKTIHDIDPHFTSEVFTASWEDLRLRGTHTFETQHRAKDGHIIDVEIHSNLIVHEGRELNCAMVHDITERKRFDETQARLVEIIEATTDFVGSADARTAEVLYINHAGREMVGLSRDESLLHQKISDFHSEATNQLFHDVIIPAALRDGFWTGECNFRHRDGREIPAMMVFLAHKGPRGEVQRFSTVSRNITERKQAELALCASQRELLLFRMLVGLSNDAVYVIDPSTGRFLDVNLRACQSLGYSRDELLQLGVMDIESTIPDGYPWISHVEEVRATGSLLLEGVHRCQDETTFPVEINVNYVTVDQQDYMVAVARDITERKQAQDTLRDSEERFQAFMNQSPVVAWLKDEKFEFRYVNAAFERLFNLPAGEILGKTDYDIYEGESAEITRANDRKVLASGQILEAIEYVPGADGRIRQWLVQKFPLQRNGQPTWTGGTAVDVTARREAEEALRNSEEGFRLLFEGASDAIFWADAETGLITHCNRAAETLLGRQRTEIIGQPQSFLHPPEDAERNHELFHAHATSLSKSPIEVAVIRQDGSRVDVSISPSVTTIGSRRVLQGIFRDITERKRAEQELRMSEERFRTFVEQATDSFFLHDDAGIILDVNRRACEALGYPREELIGMYPTVFDLDQNLEQIQRLEEQLAAGLEAAFESRHRRKDGTFFPVDVRIRKFTIGERRMALSIAQDITERKRAEEVLRIHSQVLHSMTEGVSFMDEAGFLLYTNPALDAMFGYDTGELIGQHVTIYNDATAEENAQMAAEVLGAMRQNGFYQGEFRNRKKDGTVFYCQVRVSTLEQPGQIFWVSVQQDITDRKQAEQQLAKLRDDMAYVNRVGALGELAAGIAHELNQPLTAVSNFAFTIHRTLARNGSSPLATQCLPLAQNIESQALRAGEIIRRLQQLVRNQPASPTKVELPRLVDEVLALLTLDLRQADVEVQCLFPADCTTIAVDAIQIQQVLINLIRNAVESMQSQTTPRRIEIRAELLDASWVVLRVRDWGPGVAMSLQNEIFHPFFTTKPHGMGLGLAICRRIVEAHGGKLWITPNISPGAEFGFSLPVN